MLHVESVLWMQNINIDMELMLQVSLQWKPTPLLIMNMKDILNRHTQIHIHIHINLFWCILICFHQNNHSPKSKHNLILVIHLLWVYSSVLIHHNIINIFKIKTPNLKIKVDLTQKPAKRLF